MPNIQKSTFPAVKVAHNLGEAITSLSEAAIRFFIASAKVATETKSREIVLTATQTQKIAGGSDKLWMRRSISAFAEIMKISWAREWNEGTESKARLAQIFSDGVDFCSSSGVKVVLSTDAYNAIIDQEARFTLIHLEILKRIHGDVRMGLYINLCRYDTKGGESFNYKKLKTLTNTRMSSSDFRTKVVLPLCAILSKLGVKINCDIDGRGEKTIFSFKWEPKGLTKLALALTPPDLGLPYDVESELRVRLKAILMSANCHDPHLPRKLNAMPAQVALDFVNEAIEQGFSKGALRNELVARLDRWERQQASEQHRKQREAELREDAITIEAKNQDDADKVAAWLEEVDDEKLAELAMQLEDYNWKHLLPKFKKPATFEDMVDTLPILRKKAKEDIVLGSLLAVAAGVIQE